MLAADHGRKGPDHIFSPICNWTDGTDDKGS